MDTKKTGCFLLCLICWIVTSYSSDIKVERSETKRDVSISSETKRTKTPFEFSFPNRLNDSSMTTNSTTIDDKEYVLPSLFRRTDDKEPALSSLFPRNGSGSFDPDEPSKPASPDDDHERVVDKKGRSSLNESGKERSAMNDSGKGSSPDNSDITVPNHFDLGANEEDVYIADESSHVYSVILDSEVYVRKCCLRNESFITSINSCAPFNTEFVVPGYVARHNAYLNITSDQMHIQEGLLTACAPSILESSEFILFDSGEIFSSELDEYFHPDNYCLENIVDDSETPFHVRLTAAYCPNSNFPQPFDPDKIPVRKCCPQDEMVSSENAECQYRDSPSEKEWRVPVEYQGLVGSTSLNFTSHYEIVAGYPECLTKERGESLDSSWNYEISESTGYLHIPGLGISIPSYCIDDQLIDSNISSSFAYVCLSEENHMKYTQAYPACQPGHEFCIEKCCPAGELLNQEGLCVRDGDYLMFPQSVPIHYENGTRIHVQNIDFNFGAPRCGSRGLFLTKPEERGEIMTNGDLRFISFDQYECAPDTVSYIPQNDYCYDLVRFDGHENDLRGPVPGALICYPMENGTGTRQSLQVNYIYSIFLTISDVFILISFVIYLTVPDQTKRGLNKNVKLGHSILGRILLSFLFSLFFAYLSLIITKTASDPINVASSTACIALGVVMYISFLATFFWLNVLCFELWWKCARQESTSGRRWLWYQIYAWGNPLLFGGIVLYIEFSPKIGSCFVKPNFGLNSCFFSETRTFGSAAKWIYLNGPVAILLITDLMFFLLTVKSLLQTVQQSHKGTVKRQARQRLKLCFKLFLVMGICWLTEIISAATSTTNWYITEVFNCLQGFVIFLIFILKPKILHAVKERLGTVCCGRRTPRQHLRGRLTFTASVLSEFLSSTKRSHPPLSSHNHSTSSFSTGSSTLSWDSSSSTSPAASQKALRTGSNSGIKVVSSDKKEANSSFTRY